MPRIQLYLPPELKAAMDAVAPHRPNWSAVVQVAFAAEAGRLEKRYGSTRRKKPKR